MAYRKTAKRNASRPRKTYARRTTRSTGGRKRTGRKSGGYNKRAGAQTIRLVVEQVSSNPLTEQGTMQTQMSAKKASF